jgi:hypothetical protein
VTEGRRKVHDEDLHDLLSSPKYYLDDQIKEDEMGGNVARMGHVRNE